MSRVVPFQRPSDGADQPPVKIVALADLREVVEVHAVNEFERPLFCSHRDAPSVAAMFFLALFLPARTTGEMLGDLHEVYVERIVPRFGKRRAAIWLWWQVLRSMITVASSAIKRAAWNAIRILRFS